MPLRPGMEFRDYLGIFSRRKWVLIFSFLSVFFGAGLYVFITPPMYRSTTTILIVPQRVPENYVRSTVTVGVQGRLATLQQQVTSRARLTRIMDEVGLFEKERKEGLQEDAVERMKKRIEIEVVQDRRNERMRDDAEAFSISFVCEDPKLAMLTASRLASTYIEGNLKSRERQAVGTSEFLEGQLRGTKAKLEAQEEKVKEYKMKYLGELPQELQTNINTLTRLQQQSNTNAGEIRDAENKRLLLQAQLALIEKGPQAIVHDDGRAEVDTSQEGAQALATQLALRRSQLAEVSAKYTERYPDVVRLRKEVEQLEKKLAESQTSRASSNPNEKNPSRAPVYLPLTGKQREEFHRLKNQLASTDAEIAALRAERGNIQRIIAASQAKVDQAPSREHELISLTRDYESLKKSYDDLLKKKLDADISQELEMRQQGDQFQIIDAANLPERPFKPNRRMIFAFALLMAGALGFGGAIGLEKTDLSLRGVTDFKHFINVPVLACIPILESEDVDRQHKFRRNAVLASIISFAFFLFIFLFFLGQKLRDILN